MSGAKILVVVNYSAKNDETTTMTTIFPDLPIPEDKEDKRKTVVITGALGHLGLPTARALSKSGQWFVIMACRNVSKGKAAA